MEVLKGTGKPNAAQQHFEIGHALRAYDFLARPHRFAISRAVSTLAALFGGRKALFNGLGIESGDRHWQKYSTVKFASNFERATPSFLKNHIKALYQPIPQNQNVQVKESAFPTYEIENLQLKAP